MKLGRYQEAEELMLAGFGQVSDDLGPEDEITGEIASQVAELYEAWGKSTEAERFRTLADGSAGNEENTGAGDRGTGRG